MTMEDILKLWHEANSGLKQLRESKMVRIQIKEWEEHGEIEGMEFDALYDKHGWYTFLFKGEDYSVDPKFCEVLDQCNNNELRESKMLKIKIHDDAPVGMYGNLVGKEVDATYDGKMRKFFVSDDAGEMRDVAAHDCAVLVPESQDTKDNNEVTVKIIKCDFPEIWYSSMIGEEFKCIHNSVMDWYDVLATERGVAGGWIAASDCILIEGHYEYVDHPNHYNDHPAGIECIDVIEEMTANIALAIKHLWRAGLKPGQDAERDFDKAIWYIEREKSRLNKTRN